MSGKKRRNRKASLSDSEIMTILIVFHFGSFRNFKHYYIMFVRQTLKRDIPCAVSYNRFVELEHRAFFKLVFFLRLFAFGRCTGINFVDSTMIPVCMRTWRVWKCADNFFASSQNFRNRVTSTIF